MNRLIILLDFSQYSPILVKLAFSWKEHLNLNLVFIHKIPGVVPTLSDSNSRRQVIEYEKEQAIKQFNDLLDGTGHLPIEVVFMPIEKQLKHFLETYLHPEDMVLLGIKGTGMIKKILIGSTATEIINHFNQMIIAIPPEVKCNYPEELVVGAHPNYPINTDALNRLLRTLGNQIEQVELISFIARKEDEDKTQTYLSDLKSKINQGPRVEINTFKGNDAFSQIKSYILKKPKSFFIVQKGSRTMSDILFRRFLINDLVYDGKIPLIILPS
ncbi:MAG: hypothetical protein WD398_10590 [Cyclobacteriaceae bacterium]